MEDNIEDNIEQYLLNGGELFTILSIEGTFRIIIITILYFFR